MNLNWIRDHNLFVQWVSKHFVQWVSSVWTYADDLELH